MLTAEFLQDKVLWQNLRVFGVCTKVSSVFRLVVDRKKGAGSGVTGFDYCGWIYCLPSISKKYQNSDLNLFYQNWNIGLAAKHPLHFHEAKFENVLAKTNIGNAVEHSDPVLTTFFLSILLSFFCWSFLTKTITCESFFSKFEERTTQLERAWNGSISSQTLFCLAENGPWYLYSHEAVLFLESEYKSPEAVFSQTQTRNPCWKV